MNDTVQYVAGFLFSEDRSQVALIRKNRPEWQRGFLNGIGGHIEENERPIWAMQREFQEETGVLIGEWREVVILKGGGWVVYFFTVYSDRVYGVENMTDEKIEVHPVSQLHRLKTLPNLRWLIPMCLDKDRLHATVIEGL